MLGNSELAALLGATPSPGADVKEWVVFAKSLADAGLPVMLVEPGTKRPLDMRTRREREADEAAMRAERGLFDWSRVNTGGVHLATTDRGVVKRYVERALKDPAAQRPSGHPAPLGVDAHVNWAVRLGGSGFVVADADTPGEVAALRDFLAEAYGGVEKVPGPTVVTPGTADGAHHGGGHWWFRLPEGKDLDTTVLPATIRVPVEGHDEGFSLYTGNAYVLIPPSRRPEGPYVLSASDNPVPPPVWGLLEHAQTDGRERAQARLEYRERIAYGGGTLLEEQVCGWSEDTPWEDILEPHGWVSTGTVDSCGCPVWTAPGSHSSFKSATAHEATCTQDHVDVLNPPLHLWTDNPGPGLEDYVAQRGSKTVSKLNAWAWLEFGGDLSQALSVAGIDQNPGVQQFTVEELAQQAAGVDPCSVAGSAGVAPVGQRASDLPPVGDCLAVDSADDEDDEGPRWVPPRHPIDAGERVTAPGGVDMWEAWGVPVPPSQDEADALRRSLPPLGRLSEYRDMPPVEYIVDGLLEHRGLLSVIGDSGVGKSAVVLDMAACIVAGKQWHGRKTIQCPVMYVAGEGVSGAVARLHAWERAHNCYVLEDNFYLVEEAVLIAGGTVNWAYLAREIRRLGVGLVIFDTLARMATGLEENSSTDMGSAITLFDRIRKTTKAGVLYVHHTTRGTSHGRGTTALRGALDSEVLVTDTMRDGRPFAVDKDGRPVDSEGELLPGKPLTVMVTKQKNGPEDQFTEVCLVTREGSMVVTGKDGRVEDLPFQNGGGEVTLSAQRLPSLDEIAECAADYVARFQSGVQMPGMADLARYVTSDRFHVAGVSGQAWRSRLILAVDRALARRLFFKVGSRYSAQPPLGD